MTKYVDVEKLKAEIERQQRKLTLLSHAKQVDIRRDAALQNGVYTYILDIVDSHQQEQPIKVYRVENEKEQKGLWRKFDGTWEPLFDMLTDGQCKDMPMEDSPIYREGGKQWFASAPSKETLQKWFSKRDLEELTAKGFTISEFEVVGYKKISDFEYIFTRDSIISRTYLKVSDIYSQEQPEQKKNCAECPHCIDRHDQSGWHFKGCFGGPYKGKFIAEIDECPLQQEQPEVDIGKELEEAVRRYKPNGDFGWGTLYNIACYFYELGQCNTKKEG